MMYAWNKPNFIVFRVFAAQNITQTAGLKKSTKIHSQGISFGIGTLSEQVFKYLGFTSHYKQTYFRPVVPGMFSSSMFHGNLTVQPQCQPSQEKRPD